MGWLDLVALGTVCDVVPLAGINRALVTQGLKVMARRANTGLGALADVAGLDQPPTAYHLGFVLGPRVNAGGRVGESGLGVRLLATGDELEARAIAERLDGYNRDRKEIEAIVQEAALAEAEIQAGDDVPVIVVAGDGWHPGVIGIVAGRLRERFDRPACVIALDRGIGRGSGRSVPGVALGPAVIAARQDGLLLNGGGHVMAAGFTVEAEKVAALREYLAAHIARQLDGRLPQPGLGIDGALTPAAATVELIAALDCVGPFGAGNARPRFAFADVRLVGADVVGTGHVRCFVTGSDGAGRLKAIAFRAAGTALGDALLAGGGAPLHLVGHLDANQWQGRVSAQLIIDDAARPAAR